MKMVHVCENGKVKVVPFTSDITRLQELVCGFVRPLYGVGKDGLVMLVDEDGNYKDAKPNEKASAIAGQPIVGPVVIVGTNATKSKFVGFADNYAKEVANRIDKGTFR